MSKVVTGRIVSASADKTITVRVDTRKTHPVYKKQYTKSNKISAHDEKNEAKVGDLVEIHEIVPVSKSKRWQLTKVLQSEEVIEEGK